MQLRFHRRLAGLLLVSMGIFSHASLSVAVEQRWVPGRILVQAWSGMDEAELGALLRQHGGRNWRQLTGSTVHVVDVPAQAEKAVAAALAKNPRIRFAERDMLLPPAVITPDDPYYPNAWHLNTIQAPQAWDISFGSNVIVAVLDSGVDASHPDLSGQLVAGWNMYDNNADTADVYGHGTSVAGVIAAFSNNATGVTSIAWQAKIMPVRISDTNGWASTSTIASGLTWAADNGANIANISYQVSDSSTITNAAAYMRSKGGLVFASAGNNGSQLTTPPNASIITVSATTSSDGIASWSNYGSVIDVAAPGSGIWSTKMGGGYGAVSGTSFSSPAAAAVAALIMASDPALGPDEVENVLKSTSDDLGSPGEDELFGFGRINAAAATGSVAGGTGNGADGDLNADGAVNAADILIAQRILTGLVSLSAGLLQRGDVAPLLNGVPAPDGNFTLGDALVIQRKALGIISF